MTPQELYNSTPRQFHNRLNGWRQRNEIQMVMERRNIRTMCSFILATVPWQKGKEPNIMEMMPLPGDPKPEPKFITITDEEMALRKYKIKKVYGSIFDDEFENLIREHYKPEWGPHPDELPTAKPKEN